MVSLDLLLNNSQVRFILIRHGLNEDLDNLSVIHPINLEKIDQKPLSLFSMKSEYVKCYLNCESEAQKIMSDTKDLAGIYYWYNNVNGKAYVGSTDNLPKRLSAYYYPSRLLNLDNLINRAILKYGHFNFSLIILETLGSSENVSNKTLIPRPGRHSRPYPIPRRRIAPPGLREQFYIDLYQTMMPRGYNIRPSDRTRGFSHTDYSKNLISSIQSGRTLPEETKSRISASLKGRIFSDTHKLKISEARTAHSAALAKDDRRSSSALKNTTPTAAIRARKKQVWVYDENKNLVPRGLAPEGISAPGPT